MIGRTRVESWLVRKLTAAFQEGFEGKIKLEVPPFQRGVRWSEEDQADLIRSLKKGYPIGSLLFYRQPAGADVLEVNQLIDGLQRTTAIRNFIEKPLTFTKKEDLDKASVDGLFRVYQSAANEEMARNDFDEVVSDWMAATKSLNRSDGFTSLRIVKALNNELRPSEPPKIEEHDELDAACNRFLDSVERECDISGIEVPVLFYEGPDAHLPDIFELINAKGTKLSKYEIFAASWVNQDIEIRNEKVLEAIRKRYNRLTTEDDISLSGVKADGTPERLSLFDYLFGLGKLLADEFPLLFGGNEDATAMESVAFSLATICHKSPLSKMARLHNVIDRSSNGTINPDQFEEALLESARFVSGCLSPFIGLKLNSESAAPAHTDLQIASMIGRAFSGRYSPGTWELRENAESDRETLKATLAQHYLVDVLQQNWRGSGDSRLFRMVWSDHRDESTGEQSQVPSQHYLHRFSREEFDRILDQWFNDQIKLRQTSRYVTSAARVFLKYIYSDVVTVNAENKHTFELDHIFPVSRLAGPAKSDIEGWPISAIANLALFDWRTNREKSKLDLVQYLARVDSAERQKKQEAIEKYLFVSVELAAIPRDLQGNDDISRERYEGFLKQRFEKMKALAIETLEISST